MAVHTDAKSRHDGLNICFTFDTFGRLVLEIEDTPMREEIQRGSIQ